MIRFLGSTAAFAVGMSRFLQWARQRSEGQIDKMQEAAFSSPGAEAPVPMDVLVGGLGLLFGHMALGKVLGLRGWQRWLSLILGSAVGVILLQRKG